MELLKKGDRVLFKTPEGVDSPRGYREYEGTYVTITKDQKGNYECTIVTFKTDTGKYDGCYRYRLHKLPDRKITLIRKK